MRRVLCWLLLAATAAVSPAVCCACLHHLLSSLFQNFLLTYFSLFASSLFTPICYFLHHTYDVYFYLITFRFTTNHLPLHHCIALHCITSRRERCTTYLLHTYDDNHQQSINQSIIHHRCQLPHDHTWVK